MTENIVAFKGEVMLAGWSESHNGGSKVTFFLSDPDALAPFREMTVAKGKQSGQRLMCVLVEIGDDEKPVERTKGGSLSKLAGQWCDQPKFRDWLRAMHGATWQQAVALTLGAGDSEVAAETVRLLCKVKSRAELDSVHAAGELFHSTIRIPYSKHLSEA